MDDILTELYASNYNRAAVEAIFSGAEKLASEYGPQAVEVFEQWLDQIPASEIFAVPDVEKVASEYDDAVLEKIAELDAQGRIIAHAILDEMSKVAAAGEKVASVLLDAFLQDVGE